MAEDGGQGTGDVAGNGIKSAADGADATNGTDEAAADGACDWPRISDYVDPAALVPGTRADEWEGLVARETLEAKPWPREGKRPGDEPPFARGGATHRLDDVLGRLGWWFREKGRGKVEIVPPRDPNPGFAALARANEAALLRWRRFACDAPGPMADWLPEARRGHQEAVAARVEDSSGAAEDCGASDELRAFIDGGGAVPTLDEVMQYGMMAGVKPELCRRWHEKKEISPESWLQRGTRRLINWRADLRVYQDRVRANETERKIEAEDEAEKYPFLHESNDHVRCVALYGRENGWPKEEWRAALDEMEAREAYAELVPANNGFGSSEYFGDIDFEQEHAHGGRWHGKVRLAKYRKMMAG